MSHEKPSSHHTDGSSNNVARVHVHSSTLRASNRPYLYCITSDGRLLVFKLDTNTAISVGEFTKFTKGLEVWVPLQCHSCSLIQFVDLGIAYSDDESSELHSFDSGKTRHYGGRLECASCKQEMRLQVRFSFYASSAGFSLEEIENGSIAFVIGMREFFKSAKESTMGKVHHTQQGSLMHFG
jgi:hypothetical protein